MPDVVPGAIQSLELRLRTRTLPARTSPALPHVLIPSLGASISSSLYWGPQLGYFPGTSSEFSFLGALVEAFFSTWTQYFCTLSLSIELFAQGSSEGRWLSCLQCIYLPLAQRCSMGGNGTLQSWPPSLLPLPHCCLKWIRLKCSFQFDLLDTWQLSRRALHIT